MKLKRLFNISRPRFWIYELGPYLVGIAAAVGLHSCAWRLLPIIVFFIFFTYPANIYIYGINDAFDYETDKLNPKKVSYESLVMPDEQKKLFWHIGIVTAPFLIYSFFVASWGTLVALVAFFFFAGFYSATPIRAKARPFFDSLFSAGHYIATGVFAYLLVAHLTHSAIDPAALVIAIIAGVSWAMAMHAYSAVPDIKADTAAHLKTIATALQKDPTIIFCAALYGLAGILSVPVLGGIGLAAMGIYIGLMLISLDTTTDEELFTIYTYFPIINSLVGMAIFFRVLLG